MGVGGHQWYPTLSVTKAFSDSAFLLYLNEVLLLRCLLLSATRFPWLVSLQLCLTFPCLSSLRSWGSTNPFISMLGSLFTSPLALWVDMYDIYTPRSTKPITKNNERSKGLRTSGNNPQGHHFRGSFLPVRGTDGSWEA